MSILYSCSKEDVRGTQEFPIDQTTLSSKTSGIESFDVIEFKDGKLKLGALKPNTNTTTTRAADDYCKYTVDKIIDTNDPDEEVQPGFIVCFDCPENQKCTELKSRIAVVVLKRKNEDGKIVIYRTTVEVSGDPKVCSDC